MKVRINRRLPKKLQELERVTIVEWKKIKTKQKKRKKNCSNLIKNRGWVNPSLWIHDMEANKMHREKARWELHQNSTSYIEQILETTQHKTIAIRPLTSHLKNYPSKTNKTCRTLLKKQRWAHKTFLYGPLYMDMPVWPTSKNLFTCRERWMKGTDEEKERVREIRAVSTT